MQKTKIHPEGKPRGKRDPRTCKVQAGGTLVGIVDGQPMQWVNRPLKFRGHICMMLRKEGRVITDLKWKQLGSDTWWRIPDWPEGIAP